MKKTLWIISALVAIITAVAIQFMPDKIPAHYNLSGEIDRFGSKYELLIYPVIIFIMNIFWVVIIKNFEKKALNATDEKISAQCFSNIKVVSITAVVVTLFQTALHIFSIVKAYNISSSEWRCSSTIAEFNRICAINKYSSIYSSNIEENLLKEGISAKEFNYIRSQAEPTARQFEADKVLFGKLFKEKGLTTEDFAREFLAVSKFANPKMNYEAHEIKRIKKDILDGELINWGVPIEAKEERNVLNVKSIDKSGIQKDIVSIKATNNWFVSIM